MFHLLGTLLSFALYFLPTLIANRRGHRSLTSIFLVNFFFGWTVIGWIVCLVWALSGDSHVVMLQPAGYVLPGNFCTGCGARAQTGYCGNCGAKL